jgi:receptor protein-tyrosine kinase
LHSDFLPEVSVLPAGRISDVSVNMLGSEAMKSLLAVLRMRFDYIVIDTAPVLIASDAIIVAAQSDAVLLTVRSGQTTKDALLRACDLLHIVGAKVAGIVVNAVDLSSRGFGSYYRCYGYQKAKVNEQQTVETSMGM